MENQFVPFELAVKLRGLGFNEECLILWYSSDKDVPFLKYPSENYFPGGCYILAPLWQQAFDWFRNNHNLYYGILNDGTSGKWYLSIFGFRYKTYNEARRACLEKLIELIEK